MITDRKVIGSATSCVLASMHSPEWTGRVIYICENI